MPAQDRFETPSAYSATALHELGHWTAHPDRLDRDLCNPFGSAYAREELRAEIASLILGSELGIGYDPDRHAGYVDHWFQILTDTPKEILYAAADAERISEYILTIEQKKEIRHTQEVGVMRKDIPHGERTYLAVPYVERHEAKAVGYLSAEQRSQEFTDFNDLATQNPEVVSRQLDEVLQGFRDQRLAATQSVELAPVV